MTGALSVLIADDELLARKRLVRLLSSFDGVTVVGECASGDAVIARVKSGGVDLLLLDVDMPGLTGMEVAELLPDDGPLVILCTAHRDHAISAFELGAIDYVLKPVEAGRLKKAIARARSRLAKEPAAAIPPLPRLAIPTKQGLVLLDPHEVSHIVLEGELVTIVAGDRSYLSDETLSDLADRLSNSPFERVHRRALLNLEHVVRLEPTETGGFLAHTRGGHTVEVSRQAARELRRRLGAG